MRGKTYTFVVEGGHDPDIPAQYHPFYITDDSVGGYEHKTEEEKAVIDTKSFECFFLVKPQFHYSLFPLLAAE